MTTPAESLLDVVVVGGLLAVALLLVAPSLVVAWNVWRARLSAERRDD